MKEVICHPKTKKNKKKSCLSNKNILKLKDKWNKRKDQKIFSHDPYEIIEKLHELNVECTNEICLINHIIPDKYEQSELMKDFAPIPPDTWKTNIHTWLTSNDIRDVLNQYEDVYPEFEFIGPTPSDWFYKKDESCECNKLCNLDFEKQKEIGKTKIGIVFNLDTHNQPGSHWVSLFIDVNDNKFYYFDSQGFRISPRIKKLYHTIREKIPQCKLKSNFNIIHQKKKYRMWNILYILHTAYVKIQRF